MTSAIARNYARAIFELSLEDGSLDRIEADLRAARDALHGDAAVREFLGNRLISRLTKRKLVVSAFEGVVDPRVLHLLFLLVARGRTLLLGEIDEEFGRQARLARGVRKVKVFSAFPLGDTEKALIIGSLEKRFQARVELETEIRPALIGGVVAESEGQEIELSVEGQVKDLAADLLAGRRAVARNSAADVDAARADGPAGK
jgi:F-type H+-transporting ATPase subunit delta